MGKHAKYSPSSGHRYMNCPPALLLEEQFSDEESPYAAEGTAGHKLAEHLIKKHLKIRSRRPTSDYYSDELLEAVDEYVQYVIEQIEEAKHICSDPVFSVEQKVDLSFHVKDCFGTADMVIVTDKKDNIFVFSQFVQNGFHPLFKLSPVFRTCNNRRDIQSYYPLIEQYP